MMNRVKRARELLTVGEAIGAIFVAALLGLALAMTIGGCSPRTAVKATYTAEPGLLIGLSGAVTSAGCAAAATKLSAAECPLVTGNLDACRAGVSSVCKSQ